MADDVVLKTKQEFDFLLQMDLLIGPIRVEEAIEEEKILWARHDMPRHICRKRRFFFCNVLIFNALLRIQLAAGENINAP